MSRRKVILCLLAVATGSLGLFMVTYTAQDERDSVAVLFTGQESIRGQSVARFCFTNGGTHALRVHIVRVETLLNNTWQAVSDEPLISWPGLQAWQLPIVEAGMGTNFVVRPPDTPPWRVCVLHGREQGGWLAWKGKVKHAWARRTLVDRSMGFRNFGNLSDATSEEILK